MSNWVRNFASNGIVSALCFIIAYVIYGSQPQVGASAANLASFYDGQSTRILIATVILGFAVLCLMWFAAALSTVLRDAGQGIWATAATAASAALGGVYFMVITLSAVLAHSIAGSGNDQFAAGLNDLSWGLKMLASFPVAMLIMAGSIGLWEAGLISRASLGLGLSAMALVLLGTTTWAGDGIWAPDGAYSRYISPIIALAWVVVVSAFLYRRSPSTTSTPSRAAVAASPAS